MNSAHEMLDLYFTAIAQEKIWPKRSSLEFHLDYLFHDLSFAGKRVLDIGAGVGLYSFYAACSQAENVVSLEPEAEGSHNKMIETFDRLKETTKIGNVSLLNQTFQEFDPGGERFDIVIMHNSINHLDEDACMLLHKDGTNPSLARKSYLSLFEKLYAMMSGDSQLVIADCSRYNVFRCLPIRNPSAKTIEWDKHQSPKIWAGLLEQAGFKNPQTDWASPHKLGAIGRTLLNNPIGASFWVSHFCLRMEK